MTVSRPSQQRLTGKSHLKQNPTVSGVINGTPDADWLVGTSGTDTIYGSDGDDTLDGGAGNDYLYGGADNDTLYGGSGNDTLYGEWGDDWLYGGLNADTLRGGYGQDHLYGDAGDDKLHGDTDNDWLYGGADNDDLEGGAGADWLDGGTGADTASYANATAGVVASLATGLGTGGEAAGDTFVGIENLKGSAYNDTLTGNGVANVLEGGAGNDMLDGGAGGDYFDGGDGIDTASYFNATAGVRASLINPSLNTGDAQGDSYANVENLQGTAFFDTLEGNSANNGLYGWGGGDYLLGWDGADELYGGDGNDYLEGGQGADYIEGGAGGDTVIYDHATAGVVASLATGLGTGGEAAGDRYVGIENIEGTFSFGDQLWGDGVSNILRGWGGDDYLNGGAGNDDLYGDAGNDDLEGGAGADRLDGGEGSDSAVYINAAAGVMVNLATGVGTGDAAGDTFNNIENLKGSGFADELWGNSLANALYGGAGNDMLVGGGGADTLDGGDGIDTASYLYAASGVIVSLDEGGSQGDAAGDTYSNIENVEGSHFADLLIGDAKGNGLYGWGGDDFLYGHGGSDYLDGGAGNDYLEGDRGLATDNVASDTLYGGDGDDYLIGGNAGDYLYGGNGNDWLSGTGGENMFSDADTLDGGADIDTVSYINAATGVTVNLSTGRGTGGEANGDTYTGIENVQGSDFNDRLVGDAGDNALIGMDGRDTLTGGGGRDAFVFMGVLGAEDNIDTITDYVVGEDQLHFVATRFDGLGVGSLDPNAFVVGNTATSLEHRVIYDNATGALFYDADGSGAAAAIQFATVTAGLPLTANDILVI